MYPHERSLVARMKDEPFALIGINSDRDKTALKQVMKKENITWRSFWNGPMGTSGPISKAWGVRGWPTIYVLDDQGIIRYKNVRGASMDKAVDALVGKVEGGVPGSAPTTGNAPSTSRSKLHEFTDSTGQFKITARFITYKAGNVHLEKVDGQELIVPMQKLSKEDQKYIRDLLKSRK